MAQGYGQQMQLAAVVCISGVGSSKPAVAFLDAALLCPPQLQQVVLSKLEMTFMTSSAEDASLVHWVCREQHRCFACSGGAHHRPD